MNTAGEPRAIVIRDATAYDADSIAGLHMASWRTAYRGIISDDFLEHSAPEDRLTVWRSRLSPAHMGAHRVRVAIEEGLLAGFACVSTLTDPEWGHLLDNLHVRPDAKGRGLGRRLIADAAAYVAAGRPGAPLHLWVYEQNAPARAFYDALGGVVEGHATGRAPDGGDAPSLRYLWRDVRALADR